MNNNIILSSTVLSVDYNLTLKTTSTTTIGISNSIKNCNVSLQYKFIEHIVYLYIMSPLCLTGLVLNVINLIVFSDRSFKNLTFKYLRLIAFVDCITCILVFIYCITNYTRPHTLNDKYFRIWYLVNVYFPLANITAACNVLLTLTVTIERLVSVRWPMEKQRLFSTNRIYLTLIVCFLFPILANSINFLVYTVGECNNLALTSIARTKGYEYFGMCKEILLRFIPICILICSNFLLLSTVRAANKKFKSYKKPLQSIAKTPIITTTICVPSVGNGCDTTPISKYLSESQSQTDTLLSRSSFSCESTIPIGIKRKRPSFPIRLFHKMYSKKQQQERQLTIMLVWLSTLYLCGQIPMLFAYPNFVFKDTSKPSYKYYAVVVNLLELTTYLANFFIYIRFTSQFQQVFRIKIQRILFCFKNNQ
ncbi:unnamed protein product [Rotaria sordida]|uniref:G-protein coupled receptors family 1 profile domain-containing protein n=1 Tax=Rotaria sordida TaxID=392033 RepID=A0A815TFY2_9BILA|nr:unnamed protein product [Rotaria sordida]CAF1274426.1 unnamed protein product [Rotaria sordida]CAF1281076.1 unnamed protein product [Rotaria sordida]CAF1312399.1 unnamed protein product [Rotaria sordida]CAF1496323.1 unnamed protein product [Rotaria sordida]